MYPIKDLKAHLKEAFKDTEIKVTYDKGFSYVNFSTPNANCEFYPCGDSGYLTGTYTLNGKEVTLDLHVLFESKRICELVKKILAI